MATSTTPETMPWGRNVRVITDEVAILFYNNPGWAALGDAQKWVVENSGRVESAHGILERRIQESLEGPSWQWLTANYEEDVGIDSDGMFGKKGEPVLVAIQGGGIMLASPKRLQEAYTNRTPKEEPSLRQEEISDVLAGKLPGGQQIKVYTISQLMKEDPAELPQAYAIAAPLKNIAGIKSGIVKVNKLPKNDIFMIRAGHPQTAEAYARTLRSAGVREYGNWHSLSNEAPNNPSGRVLHVGNYNNIGLRADGDLYDDARFVGVRQAEGAEGARAAQTGLERII